ncbi:MAG TPA: hypothetical protein VMB03_07560 [Bryobacteraceae bacterium]|nr:hypothetical protein [Bryobacteraceae bacterium]
MDTDALIEKAREKALAYAQSLPDFVATEVVRRYAGVPGTAFHTVPTDSLTIQLRYFQHREEHKLMLYNGEPANTDFEKLDGLTGRGEFGSTLGAIFNTGSETKFEVQKRITVRQRPAVRFAFDIDLPHSRYVLSSKIAGKLVEAVVSYHGVLEIDAETAEVLHMEYIADRVPKELRLFGASTAVDYALADIGGQQYLLPSRSVMELHAYEWVRNVIEFRDYRKFSADSSIEFGVPK